MASSFLPHASKIRTRLHNEPERLTDSPSAWQIFSCSFISARAMYSGNLTGRAAAVPFRPVGPSALPPINRTGLPKFTTVHHTPAPIAQLHNPPHSAPKLICTSRGLNRLLVNGQSPHPTARAPRTGAVLPAISLRGFFDYGSLMMCLTRCGLSCLAYCAS